MIEKGDKARIQPKTRHLAFHVDRFECLNKELLGAGFNNSSFHWLYSS